MRGESYMFTLTQIYKSEKEIVCDMSILPEVSKNKEIMPEEVNSDGIEGNSDLNKKVLFKSGMQKISDSNQPVIRCSVLSNPNPIRVSPIDGEPQRISLTVVISNVSNYSAKCEKIVFSMKFRKKYNRDKKINENCKKEFWCITVFNE